MQEKYRTIKPQDLTAQDRWDILMEYIDFSERLMVMEAILASNKEERAKYASRAASLMSILKIANDDKQLLQCVIEMQDKMSDFIKSIPLPTDDKYRREG